MVFPRRGPRLGSTRLTSERHVHLDGDGADRPARDVLVRLIALTDHAHDDGEVDAYLLVPGHGGEWSGSLL